jgi:hypothetical protein
MEIYLHLELIASRKPWAEIGAELSDDSAIDVVNLESNVVVLHPCGNVGIVVQFEGFGCLPGFVTCSIQAGFALEQIVPTPSPLSIVVGKLIA